jgi:hypothetical protein
MRAKAINSLLLSGTYRLQRMVCNVYDKSKMNFSKRAEETFLPGFLLSGKILIPFLFILLFNGFQAFAVDPTVTVRFSNPRYTCATQNYKVDVEFQCNQAGKQLFGMNVRFFYSDNTLEFINFSDYVTGYAAVAPNPPVVTTGNSTSGMVQFGFLGASEYVNGAIQKTGTTSLTLSTTGWTKIFSVNFHVDDTNALSTNSFCPSLIWDLNEAGTGGFSPAGIIISVVNGAGSANAIENCAQFNWQYDGIPGMPYGFPVSTNCISTLRTYSPSTILPMNGTDTPGSVIVPVTVTNFRSIGSFSLVFEYDPAVMTYVSSTPNAIFSTGNGLLNVSDSVSANGKRKIKMNYQRVGTVAITLSDGSHITDLNFNYITGTTDLTFKTTGGYCHFSDSLLVPKCDQPYSDFYVNGMMVSMLAPVTKIDSAIAITGDFVTYSVRVWNFQDIISGLLTLDYDPAVLVYYGTVPNAAITGSFITNVLYPGRIEMGWAGNDTNLTDASALMYVTFEYLGGAAPLLWYDNGISCQYVNGNLYLPLSDEPSANYYINGNVANGDYIWTGENSSDWNNGSNWVNNVVPDQFTDVTIDPSTNPENWPSFTGNFTLGENCKNLTITEDAQFTVSGDIVLNPGHTLDFSGSGILQIGGDWTSSGVFHAGTGTVEFTGTGDAFISEGVPAENYVAAYILSTFTGGMTEITGGTGGPTGDNAQMDVNIGFPFTYLGINYTQLRINTNGWLSLNLTGDIATSPDNTLLFEPVNPTTTLAPWWDDLKADANTNITYLTEGNTPSRVFTAEWKNILTYSSGSTARLNFQVKLHEGSNVIEFYYGNVASGTHNPSESASIGIKDATGGSGNFIEATNNSNNLILAILKSDANWPASNYRFTPPAANAMEEFYKLVVSKPGGKLNIQRDVKVTGLN